MNEQRVEEEWRDVFEGSDEDAFRQMVEPITQDLIRAAKRDLDFYVELGYLHPEDFTPEELVGETLIYAWEHRNVKPRQMRVRSWLLSTQFRVTRGLVRSLRRYRREKSISLDEPVPDDPVADDTEEWFWEWYQPDQELLWEDVIPSQEADDVEVSVENDTEFISDDVEQPQDREFVTQEAERRHVLTLHDEFKMSLPEVAFTLSRTPGIVAELLEQARAGLRERQTESEETERFPARM